MYPYDNIPPPPPTERPEHLFDSNAPVYSFTPSRAGSSTPSVDGAKSSDSDSVNNANSDTATGGSLRGLQILESRYVGDSLEGQHCSVRLTVAPSESVAHQPLFRWVHCKQQTLDFDEFEKQAFSVPGLTASEKQGLKNMTSLIRRSFIKRIQTANGTLVPHMDPRFTQIPIPSDGNLREQTYVTRTVSWLCLPYFILKNYSGLLAGDSASTFPIETLLQAKLPRTNRERDMQQAVRQQKGTPAGFCFHVSQLWCLVVDNSLLVTCGSITEEDICLNLIEKTVKTVQDVSATKPEPRILVRYLSDVVWTIPIDQCKTWFAFISHFQELWPRRLLFYQHKRLINSDQWQKIWDLAARSNTKPASPVSESPQAASPGSQSPQPASPQPASPQPASPQPASPQPASLAISSSSSSSPEPPPPPPPAQTTKEIPTFAIFTCLDGVQVSESDTIDEKVLQEVFSELNDYLFYHTTPSDRRAYCDCPEASRLEVYAQLETEGVALSDPYMPPLGPSDRQDYERRVELFNNADKLFKFFFPSDIEVPTVKKFWGAIRALVHVSDALDHGTNEKIQAYREPYIRRSRLQITLQTLRNLTENLLTFNEIFIHADTKERGKITTPLSLMDAWMYILLGLVNRKDEDRTYQLMAITTGRSGLLQQGMTEMLRALSTQDLYSRSIVLPLELVSLISFKLLKDITPGLPGGIRETYSSYLNSIESDITIKAPDRSHKSTLGLYEQEVSIVQWILNYQMSIFKTMEKATSVTNKIVLDHPTPGRLSPYRNIAASRSRLLHQLPSHSIYTHPLPPPNLHQPHSHSHSSSPQIQTTPDQEIHDHNSFRPLFLHEIHDFLSERSRGFAELRHYCISLSEINTNNLSLTKDRQERAIYAFTIVTVIFLPLSSIASIFGMNSSDIRDMALGQWVYWIIALPVTILVIFFGLLWTDELGNVYKWFARSLTRLFRLDEKRRQKEWERLERERERDRERDDERCAVGRSSSRRGTAGGMEKDHVGVTFGPRRKTIPVY
ncbi:magnesium transport protein cora [Podospora fimiseda]|uniref:Magnesium transport protein cora n=1 Tax=Podospora fimiseda TaxID=252190 RepID=A0AAN7BIS4_9PEZI|nr:magnesium transport protein cora [Podospora fimiseda]